MSTERDSVDTIRGRFRTAATSKMELFLIIVNGFQPLTIITKCSILHVAGVLDLLLTLSTSFITFHLNFFQAIVHLLDLPLTIVNLIHFIY